MQPEKAQVRRAQFEHCKQLSAHENLGDTHGKAGASREQAARIWAEKEKYELSAVERRRIISVAEGSRPWLMTLASILISFSLSVVSDWAAP